MLHAHWMKLNSPGTEHANKYRHTLHINTDIEWDSSLKNIVDSTTLYFILLQI